MKVSLDWLKAYIPYPDPPEVLADLLTRAGLEIESITHRGADFPHVVVAQIDESNPHPNADRLSVCSVNDGTGTPRQIVCGAKNYRPGDKVPLALPGAVLPGNFKIKSGKLRGVESDGMLCSAKELQLAADADGLLILPADAPVGAPVSSLFPPDSVLDLEITSNRPDWLSHVGVAREIHAFTNLELTLPTPPAIKAHSNPEQAVISDPARCPFYSVRKISGVSVGPSPSWLVARLESCGLRSINNVVDVTNFVMFEMGQPLHAFDAAKVTGAIHVRGASDRESFVALDGQTYTLASTDVVIADSASVLALAGIIGGAASGVSADTKDILLESAIFDAPTIRSTARRNNLQTDSSYRFERGIDPGAVQNAASRAAALIIEVAGGTADEITAVAGALPAEAAPVSLNLDKCRRLLGVKFSDDEICTLLGQLGLERIDSKDGDTSWQAPSWRADLTRDVDLIEEVIRLAGIERVEGIVRSVPMAATIYDFGYDNMMRVRSSLAGMGFSEARTSTLVSKATKTKGSLIEIRNPLGEDQSALRAGLIDGLGIAVTRNLNHGADTIRLFEIGKVFAEAQEEELWHLGMIATGRRSAVSWQGGSDQTLDVFDLKTAILLLLPSAEFTSIPDPQLAVAWQIELSGFVVGILGVLPPTTAREMNARSMVAVAEIRMDAIASVASIQTKFTPLPKFPATTRDLAVLVPIDTPCDAITGLLTEAEEPLLSSVDVFDLFLDPTGEKLPADRKSLGFSLTFRAPDRTLTTDEVSGAMERLRSALQTALPVEFRA